MLVRVLFILTSIGLMISYSPRAEEAGSGFLEISFRLNPDETEEFEPSYLTVVWIETLERTYVRSLLVSEYMSYGGFLLPELCSRWHGVSNWEQNFEQEMDAVTSANPGLKESVLTFDCRKEKLAPGDYRYCVQTHIVEDYNILYTGEIRVGREENENVAEVTYTPAKHPDASKVLSDVEARYYH